MRTGSPGLFYRLRSKEELYRTEPSSLQAKEELEGCLVILIYDSRARAELRLGYRWRGGVNVQPESSSVGRSGESQTNFPPPRAQFTAWSYVDLTELEGTLGRSYVKPIDPIFKNTWNIYQ